MTGIQNQLEDTWRT